MSSQFTEIILVCHWHSFLCKEPGDAHPSLIKNFSLSPNIRNHYQNVFPGTYIELQISNLECKFRTVVQLKLKGTLTQNLNVRNYCQPCF